MKKLIDIIKMKIQISSACQGGLWLCFTFSFMLCFFAPLEAYFANMEEFWFDFGQLFPVVLVIFIFTLLLSGIFFFCIRKMKILVWIYSFILCLMIYLYIQGNYVPRNYGVLNGVDIEWENYHAYAVASFILIVLCLICWIVLALKTKDRIYIIGKNICKVLFLIQLTTLVVLFVQNSDKENISESTNVVTTKDMFRLSENRNILVFILDMFDSADFQELLSSESGSGYEEIFEGFTYYPDALGRYPNTRGALPYILTGTDYQKGEKYDEWIRSGYRSSEVYTAMKSNDYSVGIYTEPQFADQKYALNVEKADYTIANYFEFVKMMYKLVGFNYMPHQLKKNFYVTSGEFGKLKASKGYDVFSLDVQTFYKELEQEGILQTSVDNSFRIYHIEGPHPPYTFDETLMSNPEETYDVYDEASGCLYLLDTYFQKLKENDLYDNTAIIVMADHGYHGLWQNPLFLIKNFSEKHSFTTSDVRMSWKYLEDIFISLANGKKFDESDMEKYTENNEKRDYSYYSWDNDKWDRQYMPEIKDFLVYGEAKDISKFECTDSFPYELGKTLSFEKEETAKDYCVYGISESEGSGAWTYDRYAVIQFDFEGDYQDILVNLEYSNVKSSQQRVIAYANQVEVADFTVATAGSQEIRIPNELVKNGRLVLGFEFPNSISPKEEGLNNDSRSLALYMKQITLSSVSGEEESSDEVSAFSKDVKLGEKLLPDNIVAYSEFGFKDSENTHIWTDGSEVALNFKVNEEFENLQLDLSYSTYNGVQPVKIYANGMPVTEFEANGQEEKSIIIPGEYVKDGQLKLELQFTNCAAPSDVDPNSGDSRKLALALYSIMLLDTSEQPGVE